QEMPSREEMRYVLRMLENYRVKQIALPSTLEEVEAIFQLNETKWKMLYYQFESRGMIQDNHVLGEKARLFEAANEIWTFIERRQQIKQGKIFEMLAYIESESCLNKQLYASFSSNSHVQPKHCCMH